MKKEKDRFGKLPTNKSVNVGHNIAWVAKIATLLKIWGIQVKNFALIFFVFVVAFGCESDIKAPEKQSQSQLPETLDWNKTASEQNLKVGDVLTVEGIAYNIFNYEYKHRSVTGIGHVQSVGLLERPIVLPPEISISLHSPDTEYVIRNPNVPIGAVVCTIYNPRFNENLAYENREFNNLYPREIRLERKESALAFAKMEYRDNKVYEHVIKRLSNYLIVEHKFQLTGTIQGFERSVLPSEIRATL